MSIIVTNRNWRDSALPRLDGEGADVFVGSPLAIIGLWLFAVRQRLAANLGSPMPWIWDPSYRPADDQDGNPPPDGSPRKVVVESAYNTEKAIRNYRPAVYVGRGGGAVQPLKASVDNLVGVYQPTGLRVFHCLASMPVVLECESDNAGESSALAETLWGFVLATRDIFRKDFGFHDVTEPILGDTIPGKRDKEVWSTTVSFNVTYDQRWGTQPIAPVLQEIALQLQGRQAGTGDFFETLVLQTLGE